MSTLCHLTGLPINEGDAVIVLPVSYKVPTYSSLCYHAEECAHLFALPFRAVMGDYNRIKQAGPESLLLLEHVNKYLCSSIPRVMSGARIALKEDGSMEPHGRHLNSEYMEAHKDAPDTRFDSVNALMEAMVFGSLHRGCESNKTHFSYLLIRQEFFVTLIENEYSQEQAALSDHVQHALDKRRELSTMNENDAVDEAFFKLHQTVFDNDFMRTLFQSCNYMPKAQIERLMRGIWLSGFNKEKRYAPDLNLFASALMDGWLVHLVYQHLGKTFYPQASMRNGQKQHAFTRLLVNAQKERRLSMLSEYSDENGYDEEIRARYQWI